MPLKNNRKTGQQPTLLVSQLIQQLDSKLHCAAIFIDLAKAFDTVNHSILSDRLNSIGVQGRSLEWFSSFLSGRTQSVKSEHFLSQPLSVTKGVPQGSTLAPTLFSIYINDIALSVPDASVHLYADDTVLYTVGPSPAIVAQSLQASYAKIQHAFSSLHLLLNTKKTKIMWFERKSSDSTGPDSEAIPGTDAKQKGSKKKPAKGKAANGKGSKTAGPVPPPATPPPTALPPHTSSPIAATLSTSSPTAACPAASSHCDHLVITSLDGSALEQVPEYKYLGFWLDSTLSFSSHLRKLQSKVKAKLGFLYRMRSTFTPSAKLTLVQMTILPMLDYGDTIYRSANKGALGKLDVLYHSAIRFATNAPPRTHHCSLYSSVNWPSLGTRRNIHWYTLIYKSLLGLSPPYLCNLLQLSSAAYNTRSANLILLRSLKPDMP